jgi:hypothetical protein
VPVHAAPGDEQYGRHAPFRHVIPCAHCVVAEQALPSAPAPAVTQLTAPVERFETSHVWFAAQPHCGATPHALLGGAVVHDEPDEPDEDEVDPPDEDDVLPPDEDDVLPPDEEVEPPDDDDVLPPDDDVDPPDDEVDDVLAPDDEVEPPDELLPDGAVRVPDDDDEPVSSALAGSVGWTLLPTSAGAAPCAHAMAPMIPATTPKRAKRNCMAPPA